MGVTITHACLQLFSLNKSSLCRNLCLLRSHAIGICSLMWSQGAVVQVFFTGKRFSTGYVDFIEQDVSFGCSRERELPFTFVLPHPSSCLDSAAIHWHLKNFTVGQRISTTSSVHHCCAEPKFHQHSLYQSNLLNA